MTNYTVNELVEIFEANGISSPYSMPKDTGVWSEWYKRSKANERTNRDLFKLGKPPVKFEERQPREWHNLGLDESRLPEGWESAVHTVLDEKRKAANAIIFEAKVKEYDSRLEGMLDTAEPEQAPIIRHLLEIGHKERASRYSMGVNDLPVVSKTIASSLKPSGKREYTPKTGSKCRLLARLGYYLGTSLNSYDNTSYFAIPFTGEACDTCKANLRDLLYACATANGYAGYGSTYGVVEWLPGFVVISERSSIPD